MTEIQCAAYLGGVAPPERAGNGRGLTNTYETRDGWVLIAAVSDNIWPRLCVAIDTPEWMDDPRFGSMAARGREWQVLEARLAEWFGERTREDAIARLSGHGIPASAVNDIPGASREPHLHERELLVEVPDPVAGSIHVSGRPIKLSRTPGPIGSAPRPGEHTESILAGLLGYDAARITRLVAEGAAYLGPEGESP